MICLRTKLQSLPSLTTMSMTLRTHCKSRRAVAAAILLAFTVVTPAGWTADAPAGSPQTLLQQQELREPTRAEILEFYTNPDGVVYSEWTNGTVDHRNWQEMRDVKMRPVRNEGRVRDGKVEFRKGYKNFTKSFGETKGFGWYCYTGLSHEYFTKRNQKLFLDGYSIVWTQVFMNPEGEARYQALWARIAK